MSTTRAITPRGRRAVTPEVPTTTGQRHTTVVKKTTISKGVSEEKELKQQHETLPTTNNMKVDHPALVRVGVGSTLNMQNFQSLRIDVSVTLPCDPAPEAIQAAYEQASEFVAEKLTEEENQWLGGD
ncbi:hypothetical protein JT27_18295 [Alcaligenes faecalis]|uniref:hypothetical protein n=1 Tax=Alcaligenes faecalis TaxID=511 RepID=UPI00052B9700|nr:hypothetical protein [Alcaligenes faecalis]KGP00282.1 hypothetical protein JT27_18295 [Alcaligenes faecalis]